VLRSIQAIAFYGMASWVQAGAAGVEALELLPRGSVWWCRVAEKLLHILPQIEEPRRFEALVREIQDVEPAPEARSDYVCALSFLLMEWWSSVRGRGVGLIPISFGGRLTGSILMPEASPWEGRRSLQGIRRAPKTRSGARAPPSRVFL
jgi:hypothetical protein